MGCLPLSAVDGTRFIFSFLPVCVVMPTALYIYISIYCTAGYDYFCLFFDFLPFPPYLLILGSVFSFRVVRSFAWSVVLWVCLFLVTSWSTSSLGPPGVFFLMWDVFHCRYHPALHLYWRGGGRGGSIENSVISERCLFILLIESDVALVLTWAMDRSEWI